MPSALTVAHRHAQLRVRAVTARQLLTVWPALDPERVDATYPAWRAVATPVIKSGHDLSAGIASRYFTAMRAESIGAAGRAVFGSGIPARQLAITLLISGPVAIKKLTASGLDPEAAADVAFVLHSGAGTRLALAGGRDTLVASVRRDDRAVGWQRVTSGNACEFCEMLADRGAVYKEDTADFEAHNHCACVPEPVFDDEG